MKTIAIILGILLGLAAFVVILFCLTICLTFDEDYKSDIDEFRVTTPSKKEPM